MSGKNVACGTGQTFANCARHAALHRHLKRNARLPVKHHGQRKTALPDGHAAVDGFTYPCAQIRREADPPASRPFAAISVNA